MHSEQPETASEQHADTGGKAKAKKKNTDQIVDNLVSIVDGMPHTWGQFKRKFMIARDPSGAAFWLERDENNVVWPSSQEALVEALIKFYTVQISKSGLQNRHFYEAAARWAFMTKPIKLTDIKIVEEKSGKDLTWHRLEFDFTAGETPTWDEILGRMDNSQAFLAWFGSLFVPESDRAQYCFLSGSGDNSKGAIIDMLAHIFGLNRGFKSAEPWTVRPPQFWKRTIVGARIVCFTECNDTRFVTSEGFKSLTGDSVHTIDGKYADIFTTELFCKFLIASNNEADISGEWAERKRIIPCHLQPVPADKFLAKPLLYAKMKAELPAFCHKALQMYRKICPLQDRIPVNQAIVETLIAYNEDGYEAMMYRYFVIDPNQSVTNSEMHSFRTMQDIRMNSNNEFAKFVKYLKRCGIRRTRNRDKTQTIYQGIGKSALFERLTLTIESGIGAQNGNGHSNGNGNGKSHDNGHADASSGTRASDIGEKWMRDDGPQLGENLI